MDKRHTGRSKPRRGLSTPGVVLMVEPWCCCSPLPGQRSRNAITADRERHLQRCRRLLRKVCNADACGAGRLLQAAITGRQKQRGGESLATRQWRGRGSKTRS